MDNLASLQKIAKIINPDNIISSQEIEQVLKGIVDILTTYKKGTEEVRKETISVVNSLLEETIKYNKEHSKEMANLTSGMDKEHSAKMKDMERILNEATKMLTEIKTMEVESEGKDDSGDEEEKQALIEEVMARIELPEYKETIITGEELIDKINELPLDEENKIDYARLKNVPQIKGKVISGSPTVISNAVDLDGSTRQDTYAVVWDAARGRYTHSAGGSGSPGGSTTQLQYNNAGAFGGISGATTDGTAVTYTANNLKAADITASGSGGFLIQSNSGTDVGLFGAGGGSGATFYGGVNIGGSLTVDTNTLYVDATNNVVGIGTASPLTQTGNVLQVGSTAAVNQYLVFQTNNGAERGIQYYLLDGTTLRGYMKWDTEEDLLLKGDTLKISTQNVTNPFHFGDGGGIGLFGIGTTAPTHSLTLNSTSTGIALYNTADQTTNYERGLLQWSSNILNIGTDVGGSGTVRTLRLRSGTSNTADFSITRAALPFFNLTHTSTGSTGSVFSITGTNTASSGTLVEFAITPTINQATTAGYTALLINPTETTTGSGSKLLADFQVGGVSKFSVANTGITTHTNTNDAAASNQILNLKGARATPTANDEIYQSFSLNSSTGVTREFGRITTIGSTVTNAGEFGFMRFSLINAGTLSNRLRFSPTHLSPETNDLMALGTTALMWSDLFLASGGVINWNNGNATLTHSTGLLTSNVPVVAPQIVNTPATITVTTNAGTVTRANKINNFTNSSAATMTITMSTTSAADGDTVIVRIKDFSAATQTITWVNTENSTVTAPTTSNGSTTLPLTVGFMYNSATSLWRCIASA